CPASIQPPAGSTCHRSTEQSAAGERPLRFPSPIPPSWLLDSWWCAASAPPNSLSLHMRQALPSARRSSGTKELFGLVWCLYRKRVRAMALAVAPTRLPLDTRCNAQGDLG